MTVDRRQIVETLTRLVEIESVNPALVPGGSGEQALAGYVAEWLQSAGLSANRRDLGGRRANVLGVLKGRGGGKTLMLNGHLDTVGVQGMAEPFGARVEGGRLYGRGALDMKGGLAAALGAAAALARQTPLRGDLMVAAVADEEYQGLGTRALLENVSADAAIVLEPTGLEVATAHKGFAWAEIETLGRAAHGSRPQEGRDAILFMGPVLAGIGELQERLDAAPTHPLLGKASVHASLISGGQELSSYPAACRLSLERRLLPGEDASTFQRELEELLAALQGSDPEFRARLSMGYSAGALETSREHPLARDLLACARRTLGKGEFGAQSFWTDAGLLSAAGIPSVLFGPGGEGLHGAVEYVKLPDVFDCAEVLCEFAREFCET